MSSSEKPLRIFISGNSTEFKRLRGVATEAVLSRGWIPIAQDHFATQHGALPEVLQKLVSSCDATICLVGRCYGSEPRSRPPGKRRRSYTQMEYDMAREARQPVFLMVAAGEALKTCDGETPESAELAGLQQEFLREITEDNQLRHPFHDENELRMRILGISLSPLPRPQWRMPLAAAACVVLLLGYVLGRDKGTGKANGDSGSRPPPPAVVGGGGTEGPGGGKAPEPIPSPPSEPGSKTNHLGMQFLPLGTSASGGMLFLSRLETRGKDWRAYAVAAGVAYSTDSTHDMHPVQSVTLNRMVLFCEWLTAEEVAKGQLPPGGGYRLPTWDEWARAAGVKGSAALYAWESAHALEGPALANFCGRENAIGNSLLPNDHFIKTAPCGMFPPNQGGFCDLAGNVAEVCAVRGSRPVVCGGSWKDMDMEHMNLAAPRAYDATEDVVETVGFRCVLELPPPR